jgi:predicted O-methyltransferase YrrM
MTHDAAHRVMKPTAAEYLRQKETVRGGLRDIDARVILAIDGLQRAAGVSGDLLEIGVSYGQSAILLGYCVQASERLVVCDTFEDTSHALPHQGLRRSEFEQNYLRFHLTLPDIIAGRSHEIDRDRLAAHFRLIHVDGNDAYVDVRADMLIARRLLGAAGAVILDDWSQAYAPGVALAIWEEYARGDLIPLCFTQFKMYATWDRSGLTASAVDAWMRRQPDVDISEAHQLGRYEVRQYSMKPPRVTTPQPADPLWRRAVRYLRLTRRGRQ